MSPQTQLGPACNAGTIAATSAPRGVVLACFVALGGCGSATVLDVPEPTDEEVCEPTRPPGRWLTFLSGGLHGAWVHDTGEVGELVLLSAFDDEPVGQVFWSPDGEHLSYVTRVHTEDARIYVLRMRCDEPELVSTTPGMQPKWSRDGWLAFRTVHQSHDLWVAHPRQHLPPRPVAPGWETGYHYFSPSGGRLVFKAADGALHVADLAQGGLALLASPGHSPQWSPDGQALSFASEEQFHVAVDTALGWAATPVSPPHTADASFADHLHRWSDDGRWMGYAFETAPDVLELFVLPIAPTTIGTPNNPAPFPGRRVQDWAFVPGADRVVLRQRTEVEGPYEIYLADLLGQTAPQVLNQPLLPHENAFLQGFARKGRDLLYTSDRDADQSFALFRVDLDAPDSSPQRLTPPLPEDRGVRTVVVAPSDAHTLYVTASNKPLHAPPYEVGYLDLSSAAPTSSPLISTPGWSLPWLQGTWHPDGQGFVYPDADGRVVYQRVAHGALAEADILYQRPADDEPPLWEVAWQPRSGD